MKILRVIASINPEGGGPMEGLLHSAREMLRLGHQVEIATCDAPEEPFLIDYPLVHHALGPARLGYRYAPRLKHWLDDHVHDHDCVIIHGLWQYHALATRNACVKQGVPYVVFTHGMLDPWFKHRFPLKHLKKWLYWPWGDYRVLRDARAVLFTSEEEKRLARQSFWLYKANERVVGYGIKGPPGNADKQKQAFFELIPEVKGKPFLLFLSRIHQKKGCDLLIEAFAEISAKYPEWHLVMAGPDQVGLQPELEAACRRAGIADKVHWPGMITGDAKWGAFRASEAFVLPSHQENFGIVVAEALACGTPVLITDKVNIWREVESSGGGLVQPDTLEGVKALLEQFLTLSPQARRDMNNVALRSFQQHFTIREAAASLEKALTWTPPP